MNILKSGVNEQPLVTIITPSLNQGKYIEATILSVLNQDYLNIEYIIMDGGSTDETLDILKKYTDQITWFSEKDKGQTEAINKGLRLAKGEILAYINSDDTYLPGAIATAVKYLTSDYPESKFIYGEGYHISIEGEIIGRYPTEPFNFERLAETCYICQPTTFWKREILDTIGLFDENLHYVMDYDYWIRIAKKYGMLTYCEEYIANSRFYPETKTMTKGFEVHAEALTVIERHYGKGHVPISWIYGYAFLFMDRLISRDSRGKNFFFFIGLIVITTIMYAKYNYKIPISEFGHWKRWYRENPSDFAWIFKTV